MLLSKRKWLVTVGGVDVSELDIEFTIHKSLRKEPNTCTLKIYNLNEDNRGALERLSIYDPKRTPGQKKTSAKKASVAGVRRPKEGLIPVTIEAGYEEGTSLLFRGNLRRAVSTKEGASYVTVIEGEDGGASVLTARVSLSMPAGTKVLTAVRACAEAMGLGVGNVAEFIVDFQRTFRSGAVLDGQAAKELAGVLRGIGITYSVQNGVLQYVRSGRGDPAKMVTAPLLSSATGLVGVPQRDATGELLVTSLLIPNIVPGGYVILATKEHPGLYSVQTVDDVCSTFGNDWYHQMSLLPA